MNQSAPNHVLRSPVCRRSSAYTGARLKALYRTSRYVTVVTTSSATQACNQNSAARGAMIFLGGAITYNKFSYGQLLS